MNIKKNLESYKKLLDSQSAEKSKALEILSTRAKLILETRPEVKKIVQDVENSKDYQWSNYGEIESWARIDLSFLESIGLNDPIFQDIISEYFSEQHCLNIDFKNDCATYSQGMNIIINDEGDVLDQDSQKWIIKKSEYETKSELFSMIEKYMDKSGYFPSVFRTDRHDNIFLVDTRKEVENERQKIESI
jgi:hypothetical protein